MCFLKTRRGHSPLSLCTWRYKHKLTVKSEKRSSWQNQIEPFDILQLFWAHLADTRRVFFIIITVNIFFQCQLYARPNCPVKYGFLQLAVGKTAAHRDEVTSLWTVELEFGPGSDCKTRWNEVTSAYFLYKQVHLSGEGHDHYPWDCYGGLGPSLCLGITYPHS